MARATTCGHQPYVAKGLCRKCYNAEYTKATVEKRKAYYVEHREQQEEYRKAYREARRVEMAAYVREWRKANPEYNKAYKEANREKAKAQREANKEHNAEVSRRWAKANQPRKIAAAERRRTRETEGADLASEEWLSILAAFDGHCCYCDAVPPRLEMEHLVPLSRGGRHTASNVAPACMPCNRSKGAKTAREFAGWDVPPRLQLREAS